MNSQMKENFLDFFIVQTFGRRGIYSDLFWNGHDSFGVLNGSFGSLNFLSKLTKTREYKRVQRQYEKSTEQKYINLMSGSDSFKKSKMTPVIIVAIEMIEGYPNNRNFLAVSVVAPNTQNILNAILLISF